MVFANDASRIQSCSTLIKFAEKAVGCRIQIQFEAPVRCQYIFQLVVTLFN